MPLLMMREILNVKVDRLKTFKYFLAQRIEAMLGFVCTLLVLVGYAVRAAGGGA